MITFRQWNNVEIHTSALQFIASVIAYGDRAGNRGLMIDGRTGDILATNGSTMILAARGRFVEGKPAAAYPEASTAITAVQIGAADVDAWATIAASHKTRSITIVWDPQSGVVRAEIGETQHFRGHDPNIGVLRRWRETLGKSGTVPRTMDVALLAFAIGGLGRLSTVAESDRLADIRARTKVAARMFADRIARASGQEKKRAEGERRDALKSLREEITAWPCETTITPGSDKWGPLVVAACIASTEWRVGIAPMNPLHGPLARVPDEPRTAKPVVVVDATG